MAFHALNLAYYIELSKQFIWNGISELELDIINVMFQNQTKRIMSYLHSCYRPQRSCEGYVFTPVCQSFVHRGGVCPIACWDTPPRTKNKHPPGPKADTPTPPGPKADPQDQRQTLPQDQRQTPPGDGYCCGRYASYWNAFLFSLFVPS